MVRDRPEAPGRPGGVEAPAGAEERQDLRPADACLVRRPPRQRPPHRRCQRHHRSPPCPFPSCHLRSRPLRRARGDGHQRPARPPLPARRDRVSRRAGRRGCQTHGLHPQKPAASSPQRHPPHHSQARPATTTLTYKEIGQCLRMSQMCIANMAKRIYHREGVQSRPELRGRLADSYPQPQPSRAAG